MPSPSAHILLYRHVARSRHTRPLWFRLQACLIWLPFILLAASRASAGEPPAAAALEEKRLQGLVNDLRTRLSVPSDIVVALVPNNPLRASVQAMKGREGVFLLSIEQGFLDQLSEEEITAVLAHELGHVWIFTHHPYLQTEQLANRVAMRIVARESLEKVYGKLWQHEPVKVDLARILGDSSALQVAEAKPRVAEAKHSVAPR